MHKKEIQGNNGKHGRCSRLFLLLLLIPSFFMIGIVEASGAGRPTDDLVVSEILYDVDGDEPEGEWVEIFNATGAEKNLDEYFIGDEETQGGGEGMFTFPAGSVIGIDEAIVIARDGEYFNGVYGFYPDFEFTSSSTEVTDMEPAPEWGGTNIQLGNSGDEILLMGEGFVQVDLVNWEGSGGHPGVPEGHSMERCPVDQQTFTPEDDFIDQAAPWTTVGNGRYECFSPTPATFSPTPPPATPTPTITPTGTVLTATPTPTGTQGSETPTPEIHLLVSEVMYDPAESEPAGEWVEIINVTGETVDITGCLLSDEEGTGETDGVYAFPEHANSTVESMGLIVIAKDGTLFESTYGFLPEFEIDSTHPDVPDMIELDPSFSLANSGDEVLIMDPDSVPFDVVAYDGGSYPGVTPHPGVSEGCSMERFPSDFDTDDCSVDFREQCNPSPGEGVFVTPTPTGPPTNTPTPPPTGSITEGPTATPTSTGSPGPVNFLVSEAVSDSEEAEPGGEWMEIINISGMDVDLFGYIVTDLEGFYSFPDDAASLVSHRDVVVIANQAETFMITYEVTPDFELRDSLDEVPDMVNIDGSISLSNSGDEVAIMNPEMTPFDVLVYGSGVYPDVTPHPAVDEGHSLERYPSDVDTDDCSVDFRDQSNPSPGEPAFPTATPTQGPTEPPTKTPIPPTPTVSPTYCPFGPHLHLSGTHFTAGDRFLLTVNVCNHEPQELIGYPLFVILDFQGELFFAPRFDPSYPYDFYTINIHAYDYLFMEILDFIWPANTGSGSNVRFLSAVTDKRIGSVLGNIDIVEFSYE